jgi:hypothetical protein
MVILKRLVVWLIEMALEALLLGLILIVSLGYDHDALGKGLLTYAATISFMFFSTGYLLTTAVSRAVWKLRKLWSYPALATVLFLIHFEIMNVGVGGAFAPMNRLRIIVAGVCIVFACTMFGSFALRLWIKDAPAERPTEDGEAGTPAF